MWVSPNATMPNISIFADPGHRTAEEGGNRWPWRPVRGKSGETNKTTSSDLSDGTWNILKLYNDNNNNSNNVCVYIIDIYIYYMYMCMYVCMYVM